MLARDLRSRIVSWQLFSSGLEGGPSPQKPVPGPAGCFRKFLTAAQVIRIGCQPAKLRVALDDPLEKIGGEDGALGLDGEE